MKYLLEVKCNENKCIWFNESYNEKTFKCMSCSNLKSFKIEKLED